MSTKPLVKYKDLGKISYHDAWSLQTKVHKSLIERKRQDAYSASSSVHELLICEHNPVYTLGKSGKEEHLLISDEDIKKEGFEFTKINRGGDITYHGPGQLTVYPIFDMESFFRDVHKYVRFLEEINIRVLLHYGLLGIREEGFTGVWLEASDAKPKRKICAIGVHFSRWVSLHGFALNVNTNLSHFNNIIPCGIAEDNKSVTSLQQELGRLVDLNEVKLLIKEKAAEVFEFDYLS